MLEVNVGLDFETALKIFTARFKKSGILGELKLRKAFESPSQKRRRKKAESVKRLKRKKRGIEKFYEHLLKERRKTQQDYQKERREEALRTMALVLPKEEVS